MVQPCQQKDFNEILEIINDAASAYKVFIPSNQWHEPYMSKEELEGQIREGVQFWCYKESDEVTGVMGIQFKSDVSLIRHAYVRSRSRNNGIGSSLLKHLVAMCRTPVLVGTWADAEWAIQFYQKHGFQLLSNMETSILLEKYWVIPAHQAKMSVVLASQDWQNPYTY